MARKPKSPSLTVDCPCGTAHTYTTREIGEQMLGLVRAHGLEISVYHGGRKYRVSRHYIAFHGLSGEDLPSMAELGLVREVELPDDFRPPPELTIT